MPLTDNRGVLGESFPMTHEMKRRTLREISDSKMKAVLQGRDNYLLSAGHSVSLSAIRAGDESIISELIIICFYFTRKYDGFHFQIASLRVRVYTL